MASGKVLTSVRGARPIYLLEDNFTGTGALTAHTPDTCIAGASWNVIRGTFGDLSGGYVPHASGSTSVAIIDVGRSDYELTWRGMSKWTTSGLEYGGVVYRSNAAGTDYYVMDYLTGVGNTKGVAFYSASIYTDASWVDETQYTWKLVLYGNSVRLYDSANNLLRANEFHAKTSNNYVGLFTSQVYANYSGKWDFIKVSRLRTVFKLFSIIGDSISTATSWVDTVAKAYNNGYCKNLRYGVAGYSINGGAAMYALVALYKNDVRDFTIVELGTNDGSLVGIWEEYSEQLQILYAALAKPIYCMDVLPRNPDGDRDLMNAEIAAGVADAVSHGVDATLWNTDGWIDPVTDTSDGLHPNAAGHAKIASQVLLRLP